MYLKRFSTLLASTALIFAFAVSPFGLAQQKKDDKKKPLPPINPAVAKLLHTFEGLDGPGFAIASSLEAGQVAAACEGRTIQIWHKDALFGIRSGSNPSNVLKGHEGAVTDLAWNGGPVLASSGADMKILLWSLKEGKILNKIDTSALVRSLAMSPDGKLVAGAGDDMNIEVWDVATAKAVKQLKGHKDWVKCLNFSSDGKQLLSGGYEGNAIVWDIARGKQVRQLPAPPAKKPKTPPDPIPVTEASFSHDGKQIALGRSNGTINIVNPANGAIIRTMTGHEAGVTSIKFHPEGKVIVSTSKDGSLRLWNPANGALFKALTDHKAWVEDVAFLAQGTRLASVSADRTVRVWSLTP